MLWFISGSRDSDVFDDPHEIKIERVDGFVQRARANGDNIVRGGKIFKEGGLWYEPTLIEPKNNESEVAQSEIFGPVLTFQTFVGEDEGVQLANSTIYGLSGMIYTGNAERAERVSRAVRAGTVWVNTFLNACRRTASRQHGRIASVRRPKSGKMSYVIHGPENSLQPGDVISWGKVD